MSEVLPRPAPVSGAAQEEYNSRLNPEAESLQLWLVTLGRDYLFIYLFIAFQVRYYSMINFTDVMKYRGSRRQLQIAQKPKLWVYFQLCWFFCAKPFLLLQS